ncbi:A-kinase-interacting protein 1-like isoform X2 [Antedon mediterranea]
MSCTLCRAGRQGSSVLNRAQQRRVEWPAQVEYTRPDIQDPLVYTSLDEAFSSMLQFMSTSTRQCKRFYRCVPSTSKTTHDQSHCRRFHSHRIVPIQKTNPLHKTEDVHVVVAPGTYAVTAGTWGKDQQTTHVVHVNQGQSVDLDFNI